MRSQSPRFYSRVFGCAKMVAVGVLPCLAFTGTASASAVPLNGSFAVIVDPLEVPTSSYSASTLTLNADNLITTSETDDFATVVPGHSDLTAYSTTLTGISTSPTADAIPNFFVFASADGTFGGAGTTPANRFAFNLATIAEPVAGTFTGTGTIVDSAGGYASTSASFSVGFSSASNYSFTVATTPEPASLGLLAVAGIPLLRRRRH